MSIGSMRMPKLSLEVKNSSGAVIKPIDEYAAGDSYIARKFFTVKNNCTLYLDASRFTMPALSTYSQIILNI